MSEVVDRAIVLRLVESGESDRRVTLFTPQTGKIIALAKSARASRDRFGRQLDLYRLVLASWRKGRTERAVLNRVESLGKPGMLSRSFERLATAALWCDFADRFAPAGIPYPELFELLARGLQLLDDPGFEPAIVRPVISFELLAREGLAPDFTRCVRCGRYTSRTAWKFVRSAKGPVCGFCTEVTAGDRITPVELRSFDYFRRTPPERWQRLQVRSGILAAVDRFALDLLEEQAGAMLPAARFLGWDPDHRREGKNSPRR